MGRRQNKISKGLKRLTGQKLNKHFEGANIFEANPTSRTHYVEMFTLALILDLSAGT